MKVLLVISSAQHWSAELLKNGLGKGLAETQLTRLTCTAMASGHAGSLWVKTVSSFGFKVVCLHAGTLLVTELLCTLCTTLHTSSELVALLTT